MQATIKISHCIQDFQKVGTSADDSVMSSRIFFEIHRNGDVFPNLFVEVAQPYGIDYESEPLEVGAIMGDFDGPFNFVDFTDGIESYYRGLVGGSGRGIRLAPGSSNVRMTNNTFGVPREFVVNIDS